MFCVASHRAKHRRLTSALAAVFLSSTALTPVRSFAGDLPTGGQVTAGEAAIVANGSGMQIDQSTKNAIIQWDGFSIGSGQAVNFQNGNGATLNRVTGSDISQIDGSLSATGSLFLINRNGVVIGKDGVVQTGGKFVASTLDINDADFMDGGDMTFSGDSSAYVINKGKIGSLGGDVAIIARNILNEGSLDAPNGTVGLAAGREVLLRDTALDSGKFLVKVGSADSSITEQGLINAANVELRANGGNIYALAGNKGSAINATGVSKSGGRVFLTAGGGSVHVAKTIRATRGNGGGDVFINAAEVNIAGLLQADGNGGAGGNIDIGGKDISLSGATVDASGTTAGGRIRVGGEYQGGRTLSADEVENAETLTVDGASTLTANGTGQDANGGTIIAWSDNATTFSGTISATGGADGGFAEVSGKSTLKYTGQADLRGATGTTGTLLLDPSDFTIDATEASTIVSNLSSSNVVISTDPAAAGNGDIFVDAAVVYDSANSLTLLASRNIEANASIQNSGAGDLNLIAGWDGTTDVPGVTTFNLADFTTGTGTYGNNNGSIVIGNGAQTSGIAVGSAFGITTALGLNLTLTGSSSASHGYAQLGYYSAGSAGITDGAINVKLTGDLKLDAGASDFADAMVGHGGADNGGNFPHSASHSGDINVEATNFDLIASSGRGSFAQIGNGGYNAEGSDAGDVTVAASGNINLSGGDGFAAFAQIGVGGKGSGGSIGDTVTGDVTVNASGDITLTGHSGIYAYAMIGPGGNHYGGDITGDTTVTAGGNLALVGGTGLAGDYAQIGAGGIGLSGGGGTTNGNVTVSVAGNTIMVARDASDLNYALLGNGVTADAGATIASGVSLTPAGALTILAVGDIDLESSAQVSGTSGVTLAAGWDGSTGWTLGDTTADTNAIIAASAYGISGAGDITIGDGSQGNGSPGGGIAVGSSNGATTVLANDLTLTGSNSSEYGYALLGYYAPGGTVSAGGAIDIALQGDLALNAGGSDHAYTQIGDGGSDVTIPLGATTTSLDAGIAISATNVSLNGGDGLQSYAQIGNGGIFAWGAHGGDIAVTASGNVNLTGNGVNSYALIGNGGAATGSSSSADISGNITVQALGDIDLYAGTQTTSFAEIGNSGLEHHGGDVTGNVAVTAGGNLSLVSGTGHLAQFAQIGNGSILLYNGSASGSVTASVTGKTLMATLDTTSYDYTQIGNGTAAAGSATIASGVALTPSGGLTMLAVGDIDIESSAQVNGTGDVSLVAGWDGSTGWTLGNTTADTNAIIAASAYGISGAGDITIGDGSQTTGIAIGSASGTTTAVGRDLALIGGSTYAQLGYAGAATGAINVGLTGDLTLSGGSASGAFAQIGHGAADGSTSGNVEGDISIVVDGMTTLTANTGPYWIGHGSTGTISNANVALVTNGLSVTGGDFAKMIRNALIGGDVLIANTHAQIADNNPSVPDLTDDIVYAGSGYGDDVANGDHSLTLAATGEIDFNLGLQMEGTGGLNLVSGWDGTTGLDLSAFPAIDMNAIKTANAFGAFSGASGGNGDVNIGSGLQTASVDVGAWFGDVQVLTDNLNVLGSNSSNYVDARLGAAFSAFHDVSSNISIDAMGDVNVRAGGRQSATAAIGHTVDDGSGNLSGDITINAAGAINVIGAGLNSNAQIGHGGLYYEGDLSGAITLTSDSLFVQGGFYDQSFARIGHGGPVTLGNFSGAINITTSNSVEISGGTGDDSFAQVGHGGPDSEVSTIFGDIRINSGALVAVTGGDGDRAYAQIGHGGPGDSDNVDAAIDITGSDIYVIGGDEDYAHAQIGHGGPISGGDKIGKITLTSTDLYLLGGAGEFTGAQVGHGGWEAEGTLSGDIAVNVSDELALSAWFGTASSALLGHGGYNATSTIEGNITAIVGGELTVEDGSGSAALGWVGHQTTTPGTVSNANVYLQAFGFDRTTSAMVAAGGLGDFNKDIIASDITGGDVTLIATGTGLELQDPVYNSPNRLLISVNNDLVLANGATYTNTGTGDIIFAAGGDFHNDSGSLTPIVTGGRWLVYSTRPDNNRNDIEITNWDFLRYSTSFDINNPIPSSFASGNGLIYSVTPVISLTASDEIVNFGSAPSPTVTRGITVNGIAVVPSEFGFSINPAGPNFSYASNVSLNAAGLPQVGFFADGLVPSGYAQTYYGVVTKTDAGDLTVNALPYSVTPIVPASGTQLGGTRLSPCSPSEDDLDKSPYNSNTGQICTILPKTDG